MQKTQATEQQKKSREQSLSEQELQDTRKIVNTLLLAWKNYGLYPEGHATSQKAVANLQAAFTNFFSTHSDLRLSIEKDRLLCEPDVIHEVSSDSLYEEMTYLLYRDGIQWLEFQQGLTSDELTYFFQILNKYKALAEETEGDIVTGLIDGELQHILFKASDIFWEDYPLLEFSDLNAHLQMEGGDAYQAVTEDTHQVAEPVPLDDRAKSIADPSISDSLWKISSGEHEELQRMVQEEENWDNTEDVFEVLMVILRSQTDRHNFSSVLDFTLEEVVDTIEQGEFSLLLNLFQSLHQLLYRDESPDLAWIRPLIDRFFQDLSSPEIIDLITDKLLLLNDNDTEKIQALRQVLLYFSPAITISLGPVIMQSRSPAIQQMVMEVIEYLCLRDMGPLEKILDHPDKKLGEKLLALLSRLKGERSNKIFLKMSEHPSEKVRGEGVRVLVARDPKFAQKLFYLIDDESEAIRQEILAGIAKHKSSVLENMLQKYIKENFDKKDPTHILACYEALGRCGSANSIPFLKRILLDNGWNKFKGFGKLLHREGAATALVLLDIWEAKDILLAASKSKFRVIREAFQKAMANSETSGENTDG